MLAVALAVAACQAGYSIYYTALDDLIRHLKIAETAGRYPKKLQTYLRPASWSSTKSATPADPHQGQHGLPTHQPPLGASTIITSNKSFAEWGHVLGEDVLATAILAWLLHHCHVMICPAVLGPR